jgi:3-oxoacyl-[acyl-carrier protein] reductase
MALLAGCVALVTGAASGMGAATARLFAAEGAGVAAFDRDEARLEAVVAGIVAGGGIAKGWRLDLSRGEDIGPAIAEAARSFGGLDIVVNNAAIGGQEIVVSNAAIPGFLAIDDPRYDELWDRMIAINLTAPQKVVRAALPYLRKSHAPRIVNIASTEALGATPLNSAYIASKAGLAGYTRALAVDLGPEGILVNCICPGPIDTPMSSFAEPDKKVIYAKRRTALRRYGKPEEVAQMTLAMCLPTQTYLTGTVVPVDGGLTARNG